MSGCYWFFCFAEAPLAVLVFQGADGIAGLFCFVFRQFRPWDGSLLLFPLCFSSRHPTHDVLMPSLFSHLMLRDGLLSPHSKLLPRMAPSPEPVLPYGGRPGEEGTPNDEEGMCCFCCVLGLRD